MSEPHDRHGLPWPEGHPPSLRRWADGVGALGAALEQRPPGVPAAWRGVAGQAARHRLLALRATAARAGAHAGLTSQMVHRLAAMLDAAQRQVIDADRRLDHLLEEAERTEARHRMMVAEPLQAARLAQMAEAVRGRYERERSRQRAELDVVVGDLHRWDGIVADQLARPFPALDLPTSPDLVGRYRSARSALGREIETVEADIRRLWLAGITTPGRFVEVALAITAARYRLEVLRDLATEDRTLWSVSMEGDGEIVEVIGDLESAATVIVVVPGVGNSLWTHENRLADAARSVADVAASDVAVVAWLGYDSPGSAPFGSGPLDAAALGQRRAHEGAEALSEFLDEVGRVAPEASIAVVGHSYGTIVSALASTSARIDDLVLLGSPGVATSRRAMRASRVWAATVPGDPIDEIAGLTRPSGQMDDDCQRRRLHHGWNPTHDAFGAIEVELPARGHGGYFTAPAATVLVAIATGDHEAVPRVGRTCDPKRRDR